MNQPIFQFKKEILIFIAIFFAVSLGVYWFLQGGAYAQKLRYTFILNSPFTRADLREGNILEVPELSEIAGRINSDQYVLIIPKIGVEAPIIFPSGSSTKDVLVSLEQGVGLYPGSVLPGESGRGVILGHSSRASWYRGNYATVFALLEKLEVGDQFSVVKGGRRFTYEIFSKKFLSPDDTNRILAETPVVVSELDIITCWPVGSASKRTLIQAKLVENS